MNTFGSSLKAMRESRGFTQLSLANAASVSLSTISNCERTGANNWVKPVALSVYRALSKHTPLNEDEQAAFLHGARLDYLPIVRDEPAAVDEAAAPTTTANYASLVTLLNRMYQRFGYRATETALKAGLSLFEAAHTEEAREWRERQNPPSPSRRDEPVPRATPKPAQATPARPSAAKHRRKSA